MSQDNGAVGARAGRGPGKQIQLRAKASEIISSVLSGLFDGWKHLAAAALVCLLPNSSLPNSRPQNPTPQQATMPPVQHPLEPTDHEQTLAYWTTETIWRSELQLRNNIVGHDLVVTPALRLPDGTETPLAAITIKPREVKSVDLNTAISTAATPQLVGTWGSVVLRYHSVGYRNLYAALMIRNVGHPIAFHINRQGFSGWSQWSLRERVHGLFEADCESVWPGRSECGELPLKGNGWAGCLHDKWLGCQ